jgi:hypothetical protein
VQKRRRDDVPFRLQRGALTEAVLLGNVSYRLGKPLTWDAKNLRATNEPEAEKYLRHEYRPPWTLFTRMMETSLGPLFFLALQAHPHPCKETTSAAKHAKKRPQRPNPHPANGFHLCRLCGHCADLCHDRPWATCGPCKAVQSKRNASPEYAPFRFMALHPMKVPRCDCHTATPHEVRWEELAQNGNERQRWARRVRHSARRRAGRTGTQRQRTAHRLRHPARPGEPGVPDGSNQSGQRHGDTNRRRELSQ